MTQLDTMRGVQLFRVLFPSDESIYVAAHSLDDIESYLDSLESFDEAAILNITMEDAYFITIDASDASDEGYTLLDLLYVHAVLGGEFPVVLATSFV